jgi:hypothetical protein
MRSLNTSASDTRSRLREIHQLQNELTSSPYSHDALELAMATATSLPLSRRDESSLVWLVVVGNPSSDKTASVNLLREAPGVLYVDSVTPEFLASGYKDPKTGDPAPSMLKLLDGKCLVVKDLTTVLSLKSDNVRKFLGDLQSIYEGEYKKLTGTVGEVGGAATFSWLACVTPLAMAKHHQYMAIIGSRFLFYRVPALTAEQKQSGFELTWAVEGATKKAKLDALRQLVHDHVDSFLDTPINLEKENPEQQAQLNLLADFLARGRAAIQWNESQIELVQIEEPFRALQQLRTLGRALARVHGRHAVSDHEFELLRRVALSSMPGDRTAVLGVVQQHLQGVTAKRCGELIGMSDDWAGHLLTELEQVKLIEGQSGEPQGGRRPMIYRLVTKFRPLLGFASEHLDHLSDLEGDFPEETSPQGSYVTPSSPQGGGLLKDVLSGKSV